MTELAIYVVGAVAFFTGQAFQASLLHVAKDDKNPYNHIRSLMSGMIVCSVIWPIPAAMSLISAGEDWLTRKLR